ncbi:MAG: hypothetical protein ACK415_10270 [Thermodesulfovibrionales bacterium]
MKVKIMSVFIVLFVLSACGGKKEVKQVSMESKIAQEAIAVIESIKELYIRKNFPPVAEKASQEAYKEIIDSIKYFDSVELNFTPRFVEIEQSKVYLNIAWKGTWSAGNETFRERGMAVFLLEGKPLRLSKILRGNPFKYPE